jgi:rhodanese-related sulfurtransferase
LTVPEATLHPLRALTLLAAASLCAVLANALAGPDRHLSWLGAHMPDAQVEPVRPVAAVPALPVTPPATPSTTRAAATAPAPAAATVAAHAKAAPPRFPPDPSTTTRDLTSQDAWDAYTLHVPFLDARRTADYADGHVPGAWSVPVWEDRPEAKLTEFEARVNPGSKDPIVLYCSGGGCEDSHLLASRLVALGYRNLLIYADGFPDWAAKSRPVEKGPRP